MATKETSHHVEDEALEKVVGSIGKDQDDAGAFIAQTGGVFEYSAKEANIVRWKLDLILLPMMTITYLLSFMDKVALGQASIFGIMEGDHLTGQEYSWASAIFYFGYLIAQYPCSILMQKLPIGKYFGVMIVLWGVATTCQAATNSFASLAACRFFLGAFETCISPVLTILVGQYWTRKEHPMRAVMWWAGAGVGGFVADGITYSVSGGAWTHSKYATWQLVFLVFGPISIAWGVFIFFAMPTSPMTAWFLTEREREIAVLRVIQNHTGIENRRYKTYQAREALLDPQVWMLCANSFLQCIPGGGLTAFGKIVITGLGYSDRDAVIMSYPCDAIQLTSVVLSGILAQAIPNIRIALMIVTNVIVLIGSVLVEELPVSKTLGPMFILYVNTVPYIMCMSLVASNIGGFTKKATTGVMMFMSYSVGQIVAPHFFLASEKPRFPTGFRAFYISLALMIVVELCMIMYLKMQNRKKEEAAAESSAMGAASSMDFMDLTDKEHAEFRYVF